MNEIIMYLRRNATAEHPVSGRVLAERFGITGQKVREYINRARKDGVPICSARWGYYYSEDRGHIEKTVESLRRRIASQESAIDGLYALLYADTN